jgi:sirohydrochlorin ferrochelatase
MIVALIDNGSLEPAVHRNLRAMAAELSTRTRVKVRAVSWKHSDAIPHSEPSDDHAWTLGPFLRAMFALGQREFVFVPFFISPQGAIGSALFRDLVNLQRELGTFDFTFADGLAATGLIPTIVAQRVRTCITARQLARPTVVVVDHGGPSPESAALRDQLTSEIRTALNGEVGRVIAASMEGAHPPLLADTLRGEALAGDHVIVAPLFLSPGRHAGPEGDLAQICRSSHPQTYLTDLVGTHPFVVDALAGALRTTLSNVHAHSFA